MSLTNVRAADGSGDHPTLHRVEEAALSSFAAHGYHAASMRKIAALAEVHPASLYHWFPSKQDLLVTLMSRFMDGLIVEVDQAIAKESDPVRGLAGAIRAHVIYHGTNSRSAFVADTEVRALEGEARQAVMAQRDAYQDRFIALIRAGVDQGTLHCRDVRVAAFAILLQCTGVAAWYRPDGALSLDEVADIHVELVFSGLGAPAPRA
ncbi:MAG TPA: TetR/AcrR family transcriptional regulator [Baekduia sp.]|nr:TetR/AcrR family transcriptional regulator [Baekduia sp.]